ncbi:HNH endonuclease [PinkBerry-associated phage LS06-2018-MD08]|nr:HNH endonuclease [PinkBerry-associated phage LS06-2018-MD08]
MKEIWKDIKGYEGYYQISNLGRVKSLERKCKTNNSYRIKKEKILKGGFTTKRYKHVTLLKNKITKTYQIHRLVAIAFIENLLNKETVNHKNGIKDDNRVENLEWMTYSENIKHAFDTGLKSLKGENHNQTKLKNEDIYYIRKSKKTIKELCDIYNLSRKALENIINRKSWKHI